MANSFICLSFSLLGPWSSSKECGQGWIADELSGNCYYFSILRKNWQESRKACQKMKSELISVESKYEQSFVQGQYKVN